MITSRRRDMNKRLERQVQCKCDRQIKFLEHGGPSDALWREPKSIDEKKRESYLALDIHFAESFGTSILKQRSRFGSVESHVVTLAFDECRPDVVTGDLVNEICTLSSASVRVGPIALVLAMEGEFLR